LPSPRCHCVTGGGDRMSQDTGAHQTGPRHAGLVTDRFRSFDGTELCYDREGTGPPVVLLHGFTSSVDGNWRQPGIWEALLRSGHQVLGFDARGHGRSAKPHDPAGYENDAMVKDVAAFSTSWTSARPTWSATPWERGRRFVSRPAMGGCDGWCWGASAATRPGGPHQKQSRPGRRWAAACWLRPRLLMRARSRTG